MWLKKRYVLRQGEDQVTATLSRDRLGRLAVQLGESDPVEVDACFVQNGRALSLRRDGRMHLIDLTACDNSGTVEATVGGRPQRVAVLDELKAMAEVSQHGQAGNGAIKVEIPGLVVAINTAEGRQVRLGETLLVLEAMKMQNEITAPLAGTVRELKVAVGKSVNTGDLLLVIEPEAVG